MKKFYKLKSFIAIASAALLFFVSLPVYAEPIDYNAEMEARKGLTVATNQIQNWPDGPLIGAEAAILMDAESGAILYAKNIDEELYPASTTKILTCLLAMENCELDEIVTFSETAVFSIESGSSNIGMDVGQSITMNQALQGILILSANEVANAVGEHISGDAESFVELMNQRAAELGCTHSHFMNANGLQNPNHYTSARDLATIAREFFSYEVLCNISGSTYCTFEATPTQPDSFTLATKNQLVEGKTYEYEYLVGSKTGYTSDSRQTLVSCAEKDGMKLICVILKEESPYQFTDTVELFNYGFNNFSKVNIADNETQYNFNNTDFFESGSDIFGDSSPFLSLDRNACVIIPSTISFSDLTSELTYTNDQDTSIAAFRYSYEGNYVGETEVKVASDAEPSFAFSEQLQNNEVSTTVSSELLSEIASENAVSPVSSETEPITNQDSQSLFINVKAVIWWISGIAGVIIAILIIRSVLKNYHFAKRRKAIMRRRRQSRRSSSEFDKYKF